MIFILSTIQKPEAMFCNDLESHLGQRGAWGRRAPAKGPGIGTQPLAAGSSYSRLMLPNSQTSTRVSIPGCVLTVLFKSLRVFTLITQLDIIILIVKMHNN